MCQRWKALEVEARQRSRAEHGKQQGVAPSSVTLVPQNERVDALGIEGALEQGWLFAEDQLTAR